VNFCPYYDLFDESYVRFNATIETMNEQHKCFVGDDCEPDCETDPNQSSLRPEASLYDDCEPSLPLTFNFVDDLEEMFDLEEVFDPSLTSLMFVASSSSSTLIDTNVSDLILLVSPLHLAQCMVLEIGESSKSDVSVIECYKG